MNYTLKVIKRTLKGEKIRAAGKLPGVMYGAGHRAESIAIDPTEFSKLYRQAGESSLIDVALDEADAGKVIIQAVQFDPVKDRPIHVDLRRIDMSKQMTAPVELRFVSEAPVIKEQGGTLVTTVHTVSVECLPKDLVPYIEVDLAKLQTYEDTIKVKDLVLPSGITVVNPHADDVLAKAARALTEEEIKKLEEEATKPADLTKIEVAGEKEKAEAEAAAAVEAGEKGAEKPSSASAKGGATEGKKEEKK